MRAWRETTGRAAPLLAAFLGACLLAGCTQKLTAANLVRKYWEEGAQQTIVAKYLRFTFTTAMEGDEPGIKGVVRPIPENLPWWADSVGSLVLQGYLCDDSGRVVRSVSQTFKGPRIPETGIPLELRFGRTDVPQGGFSVAFGYVGNFIPSTVPTNGGMGSGDINGYYVFIAREQADRVR